MVDSIEGSGAVVIESYGYSVPCRRFTVFANVTRDQGLPMVDEFILRLLRLFERLPAQRLGDYLGFSSIELEATLSDLVARGLVIVGDNYLELHPNTDPMFQVATVDGAPQMTAIEEWVEGVWFDLVSRNMMRPERSRSTAHLLSVKVDKIALDMPAAYASKAFEENFVDYVRNIRRVRNPDRLGLYSVSGVEPGRFGYVALRAHDELTLDPEPRLNRVLPDFTVDQYTRFRPLMEALYASSNDLRQQPATKAGWADFARLTGLKPFQDYIRADRWLDIHAWLSLCRKTNQVSDFTLLVGAPYLDRNVATFALALERVLTMRRSADIPNHLEIIWLRPGGTAWGRTLDLPDAIQAIENSVRPFRPKAGKAVTKLVTPADLALDLHRGFTRIFDFGLPKSQQGLNSAIEIVLVRGIGAMVGVRAAVSSTTTISICAITTSLRAVRSIDSILHLSIDNLLPPLWIPKVRRPRIEEMIYDE